MTRTRIVAFGDSITAASGQPEGEKWIDLVEARLRARFPEPDFVTVNAGVGGNTSREGLARIETDVLAHQPGYVLVQFGGNDATADSARHVTLDEYAENLERIRRSVVGETGGTVLLLTFPPIIDEWHGWGSHEMYQEAGGCDRYIEPYRRVTRAFAERHGLLVIDIDRALRDACAADGNGEYILPDGVHLTEKGNEVVADTVYHAMCPLWEQ